MSGLQARKTWGFPSQFIQINQGVKATPQGRRLGYNAPEQVSNQEPPDSRPGVLTTTLHGEGDNAIQRTLLGGDRMRDNFVQKCSHW